MLICKFCVTTGERETLYKLQLRVQTIQMLMIKKWKQQHCSDFIIKITGLTNTMHKHCVSSFSDNGRLL